MVFREAEMLKLLRHRNIVDIFKCYTLPDMKVIFIMEYLEGGELLEYLTGKIRVVVRLNNIKITFSIITQVKDD